MVASPPVTWLLLDDQPRHRTQVLGVAAQLPWPATVKEIRYNRLAPLAGFFPGAAGFRHLTDESRARLVGPWPDLVIAAGRFAAPVSLAIRRQSPAARLVHIMWPHAPAAAFDLIALPKDGEQRRAGENILHTFGVPHTLTPVKLALEASHWKPAVQRLASPRIAVMIGGSTPDEQYEDADFKALGAYATAEAERLGGSLLITSGPRTGERAEDLVKAFLTVPHIFHRWRADQESPHPAFLGLADAIIVTGDSVSMISQACATGKPVYVFTPPHSSIGKGTFLEALFAAQHAKPHTYQIRPGWRPAPFPDAGKQIARMIEARMFTHIPVDPLQMPA